MLESEDLIKNKHINTISSNVYIPLLKTNKNIDLLFERKLFKKYYGPG
jgi:hypothetical protein